ncbi:MAG TPA: hypothetical protein VNM14_08420 [Planctomycetota bacterium]|nr:hypothetical protein [Planctomycetota bacterium]
MKRRKALPILGCLVVFALMTWIFIKVIWIPLYDYEQTATFSGRSVDPGVQAEIEREDKSGIRTWSIQDQQALSKLRDGFQTAEFTREKPPRADQKFRVRIRRADSRVDEYEVLLDESGSRQDMLYVVQRQGGTPIYGSAFKTPALRAALQQILKEPAAAPTITR